MSRGFEFESQCARLMDIVVVLFEKTENKRKRGQAWPI